MSYNELKQHGTEDFPIELYHMEHTHARYEMSAHWHSEIELIRVLEGELHARLGNRSYTVRKNEILFVNPETLHQAEPVDCVYECLVFQPDFIPALDDDSRSLLEGLKHYEYVVDEYEPDASSPFSQAVQQLFRLMETESAGRKLKVIGGLYQLFGEILDHHNYRPAEPIPVSADLKIPKLKTVLSYIRSNYQSAITLEDMAQAAGLSPKYLCLFFKEMTTKTPVKYLNLYRIERASRKLVNTDLSVTGVALSCGFNDLSYFIKTFKQVKGTTPARYRKAARSRPGESQTGSAPMLPRAAGGGADPA